MLGIEAALLTKIRYLSAADVEGLLPGPAEQLDLVERAFRMLLEGTAQVPATPEIAPRPGSFAHAMPAYVHDGDMTALKWISGFATNRDLGLPYLSGLIVVKRQQHRSSARRHARS